MNTTATYTAAIHSLVNTTNGADIPKGFVQISANQREVKGTTLDPAMRYRNFMMAELTLPTIDDRFRSVLLEKLYSLAKERFEADMEDSKRLATYVVTADYTVEGLLAFYATDAKSGRMTKESIGVWFDASATAAYITSKNAEQTAKYREAFCKLASPNHGMNPNSCRAMLAILQPGDMENAVTAGLASKLSATIKKSEESTLETL